MVVLPKKVRWFCLTDWNLNTAENYQKLMDSKNIRFLAWGLEICPSTKTAHHQAFLYFENTRTWDSKSLGRIGKWWGDKHCNVEAMFGNISQNEKYCSKDGIYETLGEKPEQGKKHDLEVLKDRVLNGTRVDAIAVEEPLSFHMYGRTLERLEAISLRKVWRTERTQDLWLWGPTGTGKSHKAYDGFHPDTHYVKNLNEMKYWDGYTGQQVVVFNEFRGQCSLGELLDLVDKWPKDLSWKCKEKVPFLAKKLIVTSCKHPKDIYLNALDNNECYDQLERRFDIEHLEQKWPEGNNKTSGPEI